LTGTLWVDDIVISGRVIPTGLMHRIKKEIVHQNLRYHKVRVRSINAGLPITGLYVSSTGIEPTNAAFRKLRRSISELDSTSDIKAQLKILESIVGQCRYIHSIYPDGHFRKARLEPLLSWLHSSLRALRHLDSALERDPICLNRQRFPLV